MRRYPRSLADKAMLRPERLAGDADPVTYIMAADPPRPVQRGRGKPPVWQYRILALLESLAPMTPIFGRQLVALDDGTPITENDRDSIRRAFHTLAGRGQVILRRPVRDTGAPIAPADAAGWERLASRKRAAVRDSYPMCVYLPDPAASLEEFLSMSEMTDVLWHMYSGFEGRVPGVRHLPRTRPLEVNEATAAPTSGHRVGKAQFATRSTDWA